MAEVLRVDGQKGGNPGLNRAVPLDPAALRMAYGFGGLEAA
jgi:hypothetical protein